MAKLKGQLERCSFCQAELSPDTYAGVLELADNCREQICRACVERIAIELATCRPSPTNRVLCARHGDPRLPQAIEAGCSYEKKPFQAELNQLCTEAEERANPPRKLFGAPTITRDPDSYDPSAPRPDPTLEPLGEPIGEIDLRYRHKDLSGQVGLRNFGPPRCACGIPNEEGAKHLGPCRPADLKPPKDDCRPPEVQKRQMLARSRRKQREKFSG